MIRQFCLTVAAAFLVVACNGGSDVNNPSSRSKGRDISRSAKGQLKKLIAQKQSPYEGPEGEMLPAAVIPALKDDSSQPSDTASSRVDRDDLMKTAYKALSRGDLNEAVSFADVILLLYSNDSEALELRGRALIHQGDKEGGMSDLKKCCKSGRISCCKSK